MYGDKPAGILFNFSYVQDELPDWRWTGVNKLLDQQITLFTASISLWLSWVLKTIHTVTVHLVCNLIFKLVKREASFGGGVVYDSWRSWLQERRNPINASENNFVCSVSEVAVDWIFFCAHSLCLMSCLLYIVMQMAVLPLSQSNFYILYII